MSQGSHYHPSQLPLYTALGIIDYPDIQETTRTQHTNSFVLNFTSISIPPDGLTYSLMPDSSLPPFMIFHRNGEFKNFSVSSIKQATGIMGLYYFLFIIQSTKRVVQD